MVVTDEREEIRDVSEYLSAGVYDDVVIHLTEPLENDTTLTAVAQSDANGDRRYGASAIRRACTFSGPNGTTLQATAQANIVRPDLEPAITSIERPTESTLSLSATVPAGGFIVVTGPDPVGHEGEFPTAEESEYLEPGSHENVTVELADYLEGMARNSSHGTVEADVWLIRDNGDQQLVWSYSFAGTDWATIRAKYMTLSYEDGGANETTVAEDSRSNPAVKGT